MSDFDQDDERDAEWDEEHPFDCDCEECDPPTCQCRFCFCLNAVHYEGETCGDCLNHAHQG